MRAEQKLREQLAIANNGVIGWQHEGENVIRWLTGGSAPEIRVTFRHVGDETIACCPRCRAEIGRFDAHYGPQTGEQLSQIRYAGAVHSCETSR